MGHIIYFSVVHHVDVFSLNIDSVKHHFNFLKHNAVYV